MCDLAYLMLVERLERQVLCDRQVAAVQIAAGFTVRGGGEIPMPDVGAERARLDEALAAEPVNRVMTEQDREQLELRRALGVTR